MNGIILAGGKNSRISLNKAFIRMGQHTIIENTVDLFKEMFDETIIVTNEFETYQHLGVKLVTDIISGAGPLGGIYSGLTFSSSNYNFVVACDMPFINFLIIEYLQKYTKSNNYDVIVPVYNSMIEPLFAIYSKQCIKHIKINLNQNYFKIQDFFYKIIVKNVCCDNFSTVKKSFFNINTNEELNIARALNCL